LDASTVSQLEAEINPLVESHKGSVIFDLKGLEYISSAGVGFFMQKNDEIRKNNVLLAFSGLTQKVSKVFTVLNLYKHFKIFETREQALAALNLTK
jgi:anti-sigma B factor antagonist